MVDKVKIMKIIAFLISCGFCFATYNNANFNLLEYDVSVPPPIWKNADGSGPGVLIETERDRTYENYEFIPENETWEDYSLKMGLFVVKDYADGAPFISLVEEFADGLENLCSDKILVTVPHVTTNEAIIISACGEMSGDAGDEFDGMGLISIDYYSIRHGDLLSVYSLFIVDPFDAIFISQWPVAPGIFNEALARIKSIRVERR